MLCAGAPWWSWVGGALGAFYVCSAIIFAQKLGAGTLTAVSVTAQLVTAIALDGLGLVGFHKRKVHWARLVGAVLLIAGMVLITRFRGDLVHDSALPLVNSNVLPVKDNSTVAGETQPAVALSVSPAVH
jgi:drug/metabolite transporter (DMT)-like permease